MDGWKSGKQPWLLVTMKLSNGKETFPLVCGESFGNTTHTGFVGNTVEGMKMLGKGINRTLK